MPTNAPTWEESQEVPQWDETMAPEEVAVADRPSPSLRSFIPSPDEATFSPSTPNGLDLQRQQELTAPQALADLEQQAFQRFTPAELSRITGKTTAETLASPHPALEVPTITGEDVLKRFPQMTEGNAKVVAGLLQTAGGAANFMTSPFGIGVGIPATLSGQPGLPGLIGRSALGGFALDALAHTPEALNEFEAAMTSKDPERIARASSQLVLNSAVALGAGKGTIEAAKAAKMEAAAAVDARAPASEPASTSTSQPLGIAPHGTEAAQKAIEFFTPPTPAAIPELHIESGARLPRLQPYETEKLLATSPEGMARVPVLGAIMDPRATAKTAPDAAIIARAYSTHKGRTFAALWGESQMRNKDIFIADDTGTIALTNGERGYISDVIEAEIRDPGSQSITPQQRAWINDEWLPLLDDVNKMLTDEGVREIITDDMAFEVGKDYFPRPGIGKVNREATPSGQTGGRPGSVPFFEKSRRYATEFEGARPPREGETKEQIRYDPDAISRSMKFVLGAYRAVADHRLASDVALGGQTIKERYDILRGKNADRLELLEGAELAEAEAQLREQAAHPVWGKEETLRIAPAFQGKIYPIESATALKRAYAEDVRGWVRTASTLTGAAKSLMATADMSAPLVQGAAVLGRHPLRWAKATANSYRSLFDPNVIGKMLEQPRLKTAAEQFSQAGGSLLQLEDFLSGMKKDSLTTKIPVMGRLVEATGRAYGVFLDLAKLELWDAWSKGVDTSEWGRVAEAIESSLFMGRMEKIGLNPHRAIGERLMAFAPAYYRGAGGLVSTAFQKGIQGKIARNMLGGYGAAGLLITVGSLLAVGEPWEEVEKRLDPTKATFMKVPIETADGKRTEVGVGNVLTQIVRLMGQAADYHTSDKPIDTGVENNPYLRFLRGRAALIPSLGIEMATGRDYFGNKITIREAVARRFMPFALQSLFPREATAPSQRIMDSAFSFFGLNAFPEGEYAEQLRRLDESVRTKTGKGFMQLPLNERALAVKEFKERPDFKKREPSVSDMERFVHLSEQREASLRNKLSPNTRKKLDEFGLGVSSYKSTVTYKGVDVPLSHKEQLRYEELLAAEYDRTVTELPTLLKDLTPARRDEWWSKYRQQVGEVARRQLMIEMQEN